MQQPNGSPSGDLSPQATEGGRPASKPTHYLVTDRNGDLLRLTPEGLKRWNEMGQPALRDYGSPQQEHSDAHACEETVQDYEDRLYDLTKENERLSGRNKYLLSQLGESKIKCKELEEDLDFYKYELSESDKVIDKVKQVLDLQHSTIISANAVRKKAVRNAVILTALITAFASIVLTACVCLALSGGTL